ncbi:SPOR domain-containing protein [Blastomonas aquatica]|uniref:SPOR domain-containing protein n=1 Tax=Blastomonas aquatica TaxID=1510276 RepID=UPI00166801C7|nr:SPOR domain-containing protein [Blastomonas aquatica]
MTRYSHSRRLTSATALLVAMSVLALVPAQAQEEGPDAPDTVQPGYSSLNVAQPRGTRELQNALQRLALNPADIDALIDGGNAALLLGDPQAAIGFFARADEMAPGNGRVKAGLGSGLLLNENPYEALRLFEEAKRLGVPETVYAADRGLAYDLVGNSNAAQADYELALRRGSDDETIRRYALSLGISGDRAGAEAQLDPLLRKRDAAAWRTRAFVLAVTGDPQGAIAIADATMPKRMAASIEPFFRFMGKLTPAQQAAAAHFGQFPQSAAIGKDDPRNRQYASAGPVRLRSGRADSGLIPAGEPLGPTADSKTRKVATVDKSNRRRPGRLSKKERDAIALAQVEAAAQPVPVQARAPGPVPPSDLLIPGRGLPPATVQPLPGQVQSARATVQSLPGQTLPNPQPANPLMANQTQAAPGTIQPLPGQGSSATAAPARMARVSRTSGGQTNSAPPTQRGQAEQMALASAAPATAATPGIGAAAGDTEPTAREREVSAPSSSAQLPPVPDNTKPVLMAGMTELPKPGFNSVPQVTSAQAAPQATPQPRPQGQPQPQGGPAATGQAVQSTPASSAATPGQGGFDLARLGPQATPGTAGSPPPAATPASAPAAGRSDLLDVAAARSGGGPAIARITLADVVAGITVPPQELEPDENAVDIMKLKPAPPKPVAPVVDPKLAEAKKLEAKKAEEKKAAAKKAAAKPAPPKNPKRYWVQVAGGANRADLSKEWKRLVGEAPAVFKGKQGWWTPLNATNRLLTGPFSGPNEAQSFVNTLAKSKLSGFAFTSPEGQEVTKLGG